MRWATTEEGAAELRQRVAQLQSWGYGIQEMTAAHVASLEPGIQTGSWILGSISAVDGHVDAPAVVSACLQSVIELGGAVRAQTAVTGFMQKGGEIQTVVTGSEEIRCDAVVLACGPDTREVALLAEIDVPVHHTFGGVGAWLSVR